MATYERYEFDLAVKLNAQGQPAQWFRENFDPADFNITLGSTNRLQAMKRIMKRFANKCDKINDGLPNEENTQKGVVHVCNHEIHAPCLLPVDIAD